MFTNYEEWQPPVPKLSKVISHELRQFNEFYLSHKALFREVIKDEDVREDILSTMPHDPQVKERYTGLIASEVPKLQAAKRRANCSMWINTYYDREFLPACVESTDSTAIQIGYQQWLSAREDDRRQRKKDTAKNTKLIDYRTHSEQAQDMKRKHGVKNER